MFSYRYLLVLMSSGFLSSVPSGVLAAGAPATVEVPSGRPCPKGYKRRMLFQVCSDNGNCSTPKSDTCEREQSLASPLPGRGSGSLNYSIKANPNKSPQESLDQQIARNAAERCAKAKELVDTYRGTKDRVEQEILESNAAYYGANCRTKQAETPSKTAPKAPQSTASGAGKPADDNPFRSANNQRKTETSGNPFIRPPTNTVVHSSSNPSGAPRGTVAPVAIAKPPPLVSVATNNPFSTPCTGTGCLSSPNVASGGGSSSARDLEVTSPPIRDSDRKLMPALQASLGKSMLSLLASGMGFFARAADAAGNALHALNVMKVAQGEFDKRVAEAMPEATNPYDN